VTTLSFWDESLKFQPQTGISDPPSVRLHIGVAPPHISTLDTKPVLLHARPSMVPDCRDENTPGSKPGADAAQENRLFGER